ncbi:hypothetical protein GGR57DRAFT_235154 [Xylariaceae sp. FL1272]|nr:hypothetical protein GGR57DRAFT_235154 [Xylariaceae sp. FL1272]
MIGQIINSVWPWSAFSSNNETAAPGSGNVVVDCIVCDRRKPQSILSTTVTRLCSHPPRRCHDCIVEYIRQWVYLNAGTTILCPECYELLSLHDIERLVPADIYQRYRSRLDSEEERLECVVCAEDKPRRDYPTSPISPTCDHELQCCRACISTHLTSRLDSGGLQSLSCPQCQAVLPYTSVKEYASPNTFTQYDRLLMRGGLSTEPNFCWCTAGCGSGQLHREGHSNPLMICNNCGRMTCFTHQRPWHHGLTCREFDGDDANEDGAIGNAMGSRQQTLDNLWGTERQTVTIGGVTRLESTQELGDRLLAEQLTREEEDLQRQREQDAENQRLNREDIERQRQARERERWMQEQRALREEARRQQQREDAKRRADEAATEEALSRISKVCPNTNCGARIQKTSGCDHMTCRQCHHEFCWRCFADWNTILRYGNRYHRTHCRYHSSRL